MNHCGHFRDGGDRFTVAPGVLVGAFVAAWSRLEGIDKGWRVAEIGPRIEGEQG